MARRTGNNYSGPRWVFSGQGPERTAAAYVRRIRNDAKRRHGWLVLRALREGQPVPERPDSLSAMAAQAVEMRVAEILNGGEAR